MDEEQKNSAHEAGHLVELNEDLRKLWISLRKAKHQQWQRTLPFADYVVDRWEKARLLGFGERTSIYDSSLVMGDVKVGADTWIGPFTVLDGKGGLRIGDHCAISAGVQIYSHDSVEWAVSGGESEHEYAATTIGNRCFIGPNAIIIKGVTVGDGCVIGANSLVMDDIPPGSKAFGNPARIINS
jgi:acetyltransferase-like isoleucine patch superfamily enzyme